MNRKVRFGFVLTEDEKNTLIRLSEVEGGLSEAATLRRLIRRAAREQGLDVGIAACITGKTQVIRTPCERIAG